MHPVLAPSNTLFTQLPIFLLNTMMGCMRKQLTLIHNSYSIKGKKGINAFYSIYWMLQNNMGDNHEFWDCIWRQYIPPISYGNENRMNWLYSESMLWQSFTPWTTVSEYPYVYSHASFPYGICCCENSCLYPQRGLVLQLRLFLGCIWIDSAPKSTNWFFLFYATW